MKIGDTFSVDIAGQQVTLATVKEVNEADRLVTLIIPATLAQMSYKTHDELTPQEERVTEEPETGEHILLTDHVVKPDTQAATEQVPGQTETVPTPAQEPVVPVVPEKVEEAVEQKATE